MAYKIEIIRKAEQKTSNWSGGMTTELAIYPKDASYVKRNFKWRLSSAIVNTEESLFTSLPGFWRLIMIIEGEMLLKHKGHHDIYLKPFEQDSFSGDWTTRSYGKVRDFNLMTAKGYSGELKAIELGMEKGYEDSIELNPCEHNEVTRFFYCAKGNISFYINDENSENLYDGDLLLINSKQFNKETIRLNALDGKSAYIICGSINNLV